LLTASNVLGGHQRLLFSQPILTAAAGATNDPGLIELHEKTFALRIEEPGRADILVPGLDLQRPADLLARLADTTVSLVSVPVLGTPELPLPERPVQLEDGTLGFEDSASPQPLRDSFERALAALELSDVPDVV